MVNLKDRGLKRLVKALGYSYSGFIAAWKNEEAFRIEFVLAAFMIPAGFLVGTTYTQKSLLVGTCFIVLITELLNSAIEAVVDRISKDHHELSGRAKDMGSTAVFLSLCMTVIVWLLIIIERFFPGI